MSSASFYVIALLVFTRDLWCSTAKVADNADERNQARNGKMSRISGGQIPPDGKYPSLARIIKITDKGDILHWGAATILNRDWILTSGSRFAGTNQRIENISRLRVVVGDSIFSDTEPYEQTVAIEQFIIHERIDTGNLFVQANSIHDIAVAKVFPPIKFSSRVSPVNLPACDEFEVGTGWIPGFGEKSDGGPAGGSEGTGRLYEVQNPIVTNEECNKWLEYVKIGLRVTNLLTCTRQVDKMGWCWADWGSPLFLIKNESYMVQVGIASIRPYYGAPCGKDGHMSVYTRVSKYLGWIHRRISGCGNHRFYNVSGVWED